MPPAAVQDTVALFSAGSAGMGSGAPVARARDGRAAAWMALGWLAVRGGVARVQTDDPWDQQQAAWAALASGARVVADAEDPAVLIEAAAAGVPLLAPQPRPPQPERHDGRPIRIERLAAEMIAHLPEGATLVTEGRPAAAAAGACAAHRADVRVLRGIAGPARGFAVAAAVGVKAAAPDRPVAALIDDAAFALAAMDVQSAADAGLPFAIVVANGARDAAGRPFAYENLAAVVGGHGEAVTDPARLGIHLRNAIAATIPTVINAIVAPA